MSGIDNFVNWLTGSITSSEKAFKKSDRRRGIPPLEPNATRGRETDGISDPRFDYGSNLRNRKAITGNLVRAKPKKNSPKVAMKEVISSTNFQVTKELNGDYRWYAISSNAFLDGDREIVSTKALEKDAESNTDRGPLRWWHEPQLNLGTTDFSAMHGKMLIESGTFTTKEVAERMAENASNLSMSVGFIHPASEPDAEGVFHNIKIFERSLLPTVSAANKFTQFHVMEDITMNEKKYKALTDLVGEELVKKIIGGAEVTEKEAMNVGLRFKERSSSAEEAIDIVAGMSDEEVAEFLDNVIAEKELGEGDSGDEADEADEDDGPEMDEEDDDADADDDDIEEEEEEDEAVTEKAHDAKHKGGKSKAAAADEDEEEAVDDEEAADDEEDDAMVEDEEAEDAVDALAAKLGKGKKKAVPMKAAMKKMGMMKPSMNYKESDSDDDGMVDPQDMSRDELIDLVYAITEKSEADDEADNEDEYEDDEEMETVKESEGDPDVAYMSPSELAELLTGTISELFQEMQVTEKMGEVFKELRTIRAVIKQIDGRVSSGLETVTVKERNTSSLLGIIEEMNERLKELEGDTPKSSKRPYRASQAGDTEIEEGHRLKQAQPESDPLDHFRMFLNGNRD